MDAIGERYTVIDVADRRLSEWATAVLANSDLGSTATPPSVVLDPPGASGAQKGERGVSLYLIECVPDPPPRGQGRPPLTIKLRYLVTAWGTTTTPTQQGGGEQAEAHRLLGLLIFAAMQDSASGEGAINRMEVDLTPLAPEVWLALGAKPQPSFVIAVPLVQERPQPPIRYVRQPLVVQAGVLQSISGTVVGPGDVPLAGARVEVAGLGIYEQTDDRGRFSFRATPGGAHPLKLRILAKGRRMEYVVARPPGDPITIRFDLLDPLEKEK
jgi:hypothetical protein